MEIRPFSTQNFDQKLQNFQNYIDDVTFKYSELSTDERRTKILGDCKYIITLYGNKKLKYIHD